MVQQEEDPEMTTKAVIQVLSQPGTLTKTNTNGGVMAYFNEGGGERQKSSTYPLDSAQGLKW